MFSDRRAAGRLLARRLETYRGQDTVVFALPRGGVPVGYEVARHLGAPLGLVLVRKLGAPGHEEYGIGAVVDGANPQVVLNEAIVAELAVPREYITAEIVRQCAEIARRRQAYGGASSPPPVGGRTAIVVDDGIATGGTMLAALRALRRERPARLVLAVPVAPADVVAMLAGEADEIVCLDQPDLFQAVGLHYEDFRQTSDEEVVQLLEASRQEPASIPVDTGEPKADPSSVAEKWR